MIPLLSSRYAKFASTVNALFSIVIGILEPGVGASFVIDVATCRNNLVAFNTFSCRRHYPRIFQPPTATTSILNSFLPFSRLESGKVGSGDGPEVNGAPRSCTLPYRYYEHDGWELAYRYKPASPGFDTLPPLVCIHPVGIGLSGWFWDNLLMQPSPPMFIPDLIGCGASQSWDPEAKGLSFPLGWAQGVETLIQELIVTPKQIGASSSCVVVVQGGLAPVGVMLAARNPDSVSHLVLTSPPTWKDMTTPIPQQELERNMDFLSNRVIGSIAFGLLESRSAIEFFSDAFLFEEKCDELWLDKCTQDLKKAKRAPVIAFNAGLCNHRSFEEELSELPQPTLVLSGMTDKRYKARREYFGGIKECTLELLAGQNVLPWESPDAVIDAIRAHIQA